MHAVAQRSLRSASHHPALRIAGRRCVTRSTRQFHVCRKSALSIDPTPTEPTVTSEPDSNGRKRRTGVTVKTSELRKAQIAADGEDAVEPDGDNGNGDTVRSGVYGSAVRRASRRRKQDGIPPIKIPAWFLRHNVRLHYRDNNIPHNSRVEYGQDWQLWPQQLLRQRILDHKVQESVTPTEAEITAFIEGARGVELAVRQVFDARFADLAEEAKEARVNHAGWQIEGFVISVNTALSRGTLESYLNHLNTAVPDCLQEIEKFRRTQVLPARYRKIDHSNGASTRDETPFQVPPALMEEILALASAGLTASGSGKSHLNLLCPIDGANYFLDAVVEEIATQLKADMIRLDAQDLAQILGDYVSESTQSSNPLWKLGYEAGTAMQSNVTSMVIERATEEANEDAEEEDDEDIDMDDPQRLSDSRTMNFSSMIPMQPMAAIVADNLPDALSKLRKMPGLFQSFGTVPKSSGSEATNSRGWRSGGQEWNDMKVSALLISLMQAHRLKYHDHNKAALIPVDVVGSRAGRQIFAEEADIVDPIVNVDSPATADEPVLESKETDKQSNADASPSPRGNNNNNQASRLIIHIRGFRDIQATSSGTRIINRILEIVAKRQITGHQIIIVGTSASTALAPTLSSPIMKFLQSEGTNSDFTSVVVTTKAPLTEEDRARRGEQFANDRLRYAFDVNARHMHNLSLRMQEQPHDPDAVDWAQFSHDLRSSLTSNPSGSMILSSLESRLVPSGDVQRLISTAIGRSGVSKPLEHFQGGLTGEDIANAAVLLEESQAAKNSWVQRMQQIEEHPRIQLPFGQSLRLPMPTIDAPAQDPLVERNKKKMNAREKSLMKGVVNPSNIHVTFDDVHAPTETKETLKMLTTLALKRPDAFQYGVLAKDRISGLLLYGPPGTGKTLLAKAVAKESGATMLEVSGADMLEMYVGEGEKNIQAVFSLAKKLAPCVVFIDEADSIFAARRSSGQHHAHRELLNQFLKEWDGMQETTAFIMIATNRPFDIDQAALRRVPRRVLVDLPSEKDREAILRIHLKDEIMNDSASIASLAERTPLYSGSDLKNIAVAAALAAVREENDEAARHTGEQPFEYPERRTLHMRHFEKALEEISASISEDMDTLGAIRKFDEKYGDRRGRKKKTAYGFAGAGEVKEDAAKVRT